MRLGLDLNRRRLSWLPAALFRSGEAGAWFDASDLTTLFQDSVGTTPVTAAADPVGLWLDKSQGLALGAELLANGTFAADTTGWTPFSATFAAVAGEGLLTVNVAGSYPTISSDAFTTVVGKTYKVVLRARRGTGSTTLVARAKTSIGGNLTAALPIAQTTSMTTTTFYFVATTTSSRLDIYDNSASSAGGTFYLDDVSIKSLADNHALQATAGLRPLRRRFPAGGVRNLIDNTPFAGAVSGTPGTGPTSWTRFNSLGTITAATDTLRVSCTAARDQFGQVYAASASTNYIVSALVTVNSGTITVQNTIDFPAPLAGSTVTWQIDGVTVAGSTAVSVGAHTVAALIAVAGTAGNINARIGVGVNGNVTADVTFTAPQLEVGTARSVYQTRVSANDVTETGKASILALRHDLVDDALVVTLPNLGTAATVIWGQADGAHFLTAQTISGATTLPQVADLTGVTYLNRALTLAETARMTAYYNRVAGL